MVNPDLGRAGGITECRRIAWIADAFGALWAPHVSTGSAPYMAASIHMAVSSPNCAMMEVYNGNKQDGPFGNRLLKEPLDMGAGLRARAGTPRARCRFRRAGARVDKGGVALSNIRDAAGPLTRRMLLGSAVAAGATALFRPRVNAQEAGRERQERIDAAGPLTIRKVEAFVIRNPPTPIGFDEPLELPSVGDMTGGVGIWNRLDHASPTRFKGFEQAVLVKITRPPRGCRGGVSATHHRRRACNSGSSTTCSRRFFAARTRAASTVYGSDSSRPNGCAVIRRAHSSRRSRALTWRCGTCREKRWVFPSTSCWVGNTAMHSRCIAASEAQQRKRSSLMRRLPSRPACRWSR